LWQQKKGRATNFFSPLSFVAYFGSGIWDPGSGIWDPGSGMDKNQDPGFGIRDKHPGSAALKNPMQLARSIVHVQSGDNDHPSGL
jgi:hypothetical protein